MSTMEADQIFVTMDKLRVEDSDIIVCKAADGSGQAEPIRAVGMYVQEWALKRNILIADKIIYLGAGLSIAKMRESEMNELGWYRKEQL